MVGGIGTLLAWTIGFGLLRGPRVLEPFVACQADSNRLRSAPGRQREGVRLCPGHRPVEGAAIFALVGHYFLLEFDT